MKKWTRLWIICRLPFFKHGLYAAKYLKKKKVFGTQGENCSYHARSLPSEPELLFLGNNVHISSGVRFLTHDIISDMFERDEKYKDMKFPWKTGTIKIGNNVVIGAYATILYGIEIGNNVVIAAGAVVTKNIPDGEVWGGFPAKKISLTDDLAKKRGIK